MIIKKDHPIYEIHIEKRNPYMHGFGEHQQDWEPVFLDASKVGDLSDKETIDWISQMFSVKRTVVEDAFYKAKAVSIGKDESEEPWHWQIQQTKYYEGHKYILWRCSDYKAILN